MNRSIALVLAIVLLIVLALGGFFLYLTGGEEVSGGDGPAPEVGLIHVRSIYVAGDENLRRPVGIGADDSGNFFITLRDTHRIVEFDSDGDFVNIWGESGAQPGQLLAPLSVAVDRLADAVYVVDRSRLRLIAYTTDGTYLWEIPMLSPLGVALHPDGVIVTSFGPLTVLDGEGQVVAESGTRGPAPGQFDYPRSAVSLESGDVVVADTNNARLQRVAVSGEVTSTVAWILGTPPQMQDDPDTLFGVPSGITADDEGRVFALDGFRSSITVIDPESGEILHTFEDLAGQSDGFFNLPTSIAYLGGDEFAITDTYNDRVQIVRLLLPEENTLLARNPWIQWLGLLPLLLLLAFLGRKRAFASEELLEHAVAEGNARLFMAVYKTLRVLPAVYERYADVTEEDARLGDYLESVGESTDVDEAALAQLARPTGLRRLLLSRHTIVCLDTDQAGRFEELGYKRIETYDEVLAEYEMKDVETSV